MKVLKVDPKNPACLLGSGDVALAGKDLKKARWYFFSILNTRENPLFVRTRIQALLQLARAELGLKNFKRAKELLIRYRTFEPLQPQSYYFLARVAETEKDFTQAVGRYKQFKRRFLRANKVSLSRGKKIRDLRRIEGKMLTLEKRLDNLLEA